VITKDHTEGLEEMDKLSDFAPLHVRHPFSGQGRSSQNRTIMPSWLSELVLMLYPITLQFCFSTPSSMYARYSHACATTDHQQTIPQATRTYALPPSELDNPMSLQKYGFHGLSYASIVDSVAKHLKKPADQVDIVVAHLGSGASAACIQSGKSIDTSELPLPRAFREIS
jgi:acetate kinase